MPNSLVRNALASYRATNEDKPVQKAPEQQPPQQAQQPMQYQQPPQQAQQPMQYQQPPQQAQQPMQYQQPVQYQQQYQQPMQGYMTQPQFPGQGNYQNLGGMNDVDAELRAIAEQLDVCIKIVGCGGGGSNTINRCVEGGINGAQLCAINTDAKHLLIVKSPNKILIGKSSTRGLGAGAIPEVGEAAARESDMEIRNFLTGSNIVFVTAGMGGGTGTGSAHYVARISKEQMRALTLGVVSLPFKAEGAVRMENAMAGLEKMRRICDTTIVIPNDKIVELVPNLPIDQAFKVADEVLMQTIKGLTEIITQPGLVNLDYSDIQTVMKEGGVAFVGIGEADESKDKKVEKAVHEALNSPLLGEIDLAQARGVLIRVVGGPDMTISEAEKAAEIVSSTVSSRARIIWGCSVDPELEGQIRILLIVTGAKSDYMIGANDEGFPAVDEYGRDSYSSQVDDTGIDFIR